MYMDKEYIILLKIIEIVNRDESDALEQIKTEIEDYSKTRHIHKLEYGVFNNNNFADNYKNTQNLYFMQRF